MRNLLLVIICIALAPLNMLSQQSFTIEDEKAITYYLEARQQLQFENFAGAIEKLEDAIDREPNFMEAYIMLAKVYESVNQFEKQLQTIEQALMRNPGDFAPLYSEAARAFYYNGQYDRALEAMELFTNRDKITNSDRQEAEYYTKLLKWALKNKNNPVPFEPEKVELGVKDGHGNYFPVISTDGQTMVFTAKLPNENTRMAEQTGLIFQEDFYYSEKKDGQWTVARPLEGPVNTDGNEGAQCISSDGEVIFFTSCTRIDLIGACDLYYTFREEGKWVQPYNVGPPVNTTYYEGQPSLSPDMQQLYFISDAPGGYGGKDIYVSTLGRDGYWGEPVNLGKGINTAEDEESPFIHPDNNTLYFSSKGHIGMGRADIYVARRQPDGSWGQVQNLGYPINTHNDEYDFIVGPDAKMAYFSSTRFNANNQSDIYQFELYRDVRPKPVTYMKGRIYDADTRQALQAYFQLTRLSDGTPSARTISDKQGKFFISIAAGENYALTVERKGYLLHSENFALADSFDLGEPYVKDIYLIPVKGQTENKTVRLENVFFEHDSYELKKESEVELNKLASFMRNSPEVKIEIMGHTDSLGDDQYNLELSENRARSVYTFLIEQGIDAERLSYKGYGEEKPVAPNSTARGRALNRRTEYRVLD